MKVVNNQQLTSLHNRRVVVAKKQTPPMNKPKFVGRTLEQELAIRSYNEKLRTNYGATLNQKSKFEPTYHDDMRRKYRTIHNNSNTLWYEIDRNEWRPAMSETEKEQWKLYKQLKKEYEQSKALRELTPTEQKVATATRSKSVKLLNGLANSPRFDRIYNS